MSGRTAGPIKTKLGIGTHVDPGSVLVKVKVIYLCVRCNRIHACDTWRITMNHARISISSSSSSCHLVNANKTPERIRAHEARYPVRGTQGPTEFEVFFRPEDGYLQLVCYNSSLFRI